MKEAAKLWYIDSKMVDAVNRCMDAISACGLSADSAEYPPLLLRSCDQGKQSDFRAKHPVSRNARKGQ